MNLDPLSTKNRGLSSDFDLKARAKTSLRMQYEAQAEVLRRQMGGLAGVQAQLALSGRRICQLLLVDPSAWSRWSKDDSQVPPHVWRALQWHFALQEKIPGLNAQYFLGRDTQNIEKTMEKKWETHDQISDQKWEKLRSQEALLGQEIGRLSFSLKRIRIWNGVLLCLNSGLVLYLALRFWAV